MENDRVVAEFFLNTCRLRPRLNVVDLLVIRQTADLVNIAAACDNELDVTPLSTGSVAEFYIEPMFSCVGDIDIMFHLSRDLTIPEGHLPPTQLPAEFHGRVSVYEIIDSAFPGYVYLVKSYLLTEINDDGKYNAMQCPRQYAALDNLDSDIIQGPAIVVKGLTPTKSVSRDLVICVRCLSWPSQAADWPTRHRIYSWPDSATVDRLVSNGCDVVEVAHRLCRQDEWMSKLQYRLSFSRAEITLLNSWMPVQQIVYHMLRSFMKTDESLTDITDNTGHKILSNYNIKTLTLGACEMKGRSWWIDE